jgi:hypothetical protein
MQQPPSNTRWVLYSPGPPDPEPLPPLPDWVQRISSGPKATFGELEDCPTIPEVLAEGWTCAVIPEYITSRTLIASILSPEGRYAMLFIHPVGPELDQRPRPGSTDLIGWFHLRLCEPVACYRSLVTNLRHAVSVLARANLIPSTAVQPPGAEA